MRGLLYILLLTLPILGACSQGNAGPETSTLPPTQFPQSATLEEEPLRDIADREPPDTVIIIGDSIMASAYDYNQVLTYNDTAAALLVDDNIRTVNISKGGQTVENADTDGVAGAVGFAAGSNTAIWIEVGFNDWFWFQQTQTDFSVNYVALLNDLYVAMDGKPHTIYCVTMPLNGFEFTYPTNGGGATLNDFRTTIIAAANYGLCELVDTASWFSLAQVYDGLTMPDTLHLGPAGHTLYKQKLLETITH